MGDRRSPSERTRGDVRSDRRQQDTLSLDQGSRQKPGPDGEQDGVSGDEVLAGSEADEDRKGARDHVQPQLMSR